MNKNNEFKSELADFRDNLFDVLTDAFSRTEEEKKAKKLEKYAIYDVEDIDTLLTSNLPYKEKMEFLRSERQRAAEVVESIDEAEDQYHNTKMFLNGMKRALRGIISDLKMDIPFTIGGVTFSTISICQLSKYLETHTFADMEIHELLASFIGTVFMPILSAFYVYYTARDLNSFNKYAREIKSYERRLRKNRQ
jgi:hypothetical protein